MKNHRDPYDGFRSDQERRKALATRERTTAASRVLIAIALAASGKLPALFEAGIRFIFRN